MKISVLSNTNIEALARTLGKKYELYKAAGYNNWLQELLDKESGLNGFEPDAVFVLLDGRELINTCDSTEELKKQIDGYFGYIVEYLKIKAESTSVFISNLDIPIRRIQCPGKPVFERVAEHYWYECLTGLCGENKKLYIFDMKSMVENIGRNELYSDKLWYLGSIRYSLKGQKSIEKELDKYIRAMEGSRKKCIVLDLDNTLWGGVVGEAGLEGIELAGQKEGARYRDFQKRLKDIKDTGVILAVVSKNNYNDAIEVFRNHKDMYLREEDFAVMKIDWEYKPLSIEKLAAELNIGFDSIVFIDDNPVEREAVKHSLPQVTVPDFPEDTSELEAFITRIYNDYFFSISITEEDRVKTDMYRQNSLREAAMKASNSIEDYLYGLETVIRIGKAGEEDIPRIAQLTQKTNQFNLTTRRYTEKDIGKMLASSDLDVYTASVKDKYGDNGKTVVLIIRRDKYLVEIDTFLMSCRIMGRYVEDRIIAFIEDKYRTQGFKELKASYLKTSKNLPVSGLFGRLGYEQCGQDSEGNKDYILRLDQKLANRKNYGELVEL